VIQPTAVDEDVLEGDINIKVRRRGNDEVCVCILIGTKTIVDECYS
jgi:hypothetical protein